MLFNRFIMKSYKKIFFLMKFYEKAYHIIVFYIPTTIEAYYKLLPLYHYACDYSLLINYYFNIKQVFILI